jgi:hypothetical protein
MCGVVYSGLAWLVQSLTSKLISRQRSSKMSKRALATMERHVRSNVHEMMLETLRTRNATEPRDMSFALHSILTRLPGHTELPMINYKIPFPRVHLPLTRLLLHSSKSLQVLTLAARHRCKGAPSWVLDYSRVGIAESIDADLGFQIKGDWNTDRLAKTVLRNEENMVLICSRWD